jgi:hypothetical protein
METRRWTNPSQPQTLYMATFLLYIEAVLQVIFGSLVSLLGPIFVIAYVVGGVAGGLGIANERKWGYYVGVGAAVVGLLPIVVIVATQGVGAIFSLALIFNALFPVALFALLVHPMSREYQKIWFH